MPKKTRRFQQKQKQTRKQSILHHPLVKYESKNLWVKSVVNRRVRRYKEDWKVFYPHIIFRGGGTEKSITVQNYIFVYDETESTILCIPRSEKGVCFKIDFDFESFTIGVSIGYFPSCAISQDLPESSGTLIMLQAVLQLIFQHPRIREFSGIVINDNSYLFVKSYQDGKKYRTDLMDMYFISTGCTWYSSLVPMFLQRFSDDVRYLNDRVKIVGGDRDYLIDTSDTKEYPIRWSSFLNNLTPLVKKEIVNIVGDVESNQMASTILNRIRKDRTYSIIFYKYMPEIQNALGGIDRLHGKAWIIPLLNGKIVYSESDASIAGCINEKGWMIPKELLIEVTNREYMDIKKSLQILDTESVNYEGMELSVTKREYNPSSAPNDMFNLVSNNLSFDDDILFSKPVQKTLP